jgi:hypothetical protein
VCNLPPVGVTYFVSDLAKGIHVSQPRAAAL